MIPASPAPSHALFILQNVFVPVALKIPERPAKLVHQNSPAAKGPLRQPVDGQVFCKSFKSSPIHTHFQPWGFPSYSKNTPKWLCVIVFTVFSALTKTYPGKEGIRSTSCHLGRWASRTALQNNLPLCPTICPWQFQSYWGLKMKKRNKTKKCTNPANLPPEIPEPGCPKQEHKNII